MSAETMQQGQAFTKDFIINMVLVPLDLRSEPMSRRRLAKSARKTNAFKLELNDQERDAFEAGADRFGVELATYLRTLILAAHSGELPVNPTMFNGAE
jgi:hypothetical protein